MLARSAIRKRIWRESVNKSRDFKTIVKISRSFGFGKPRLKHRLNMLLCLSVWVGGRNAPNESEMWKDLCILSPSLSLAPAQFDAALFIGSHHLWCYWMCQFDIHTRVSNVLTSNSFSSPTSYWQPILQAKQHAIYWVHKFKPTYLMFQLVHRFCLHIKYSFTSENHRLLLAWKSDTLSTIIQLLCADCGLHVFLMKTCTINGNTRKCRNHCYSLRFVLVTNFVGPWVLPSKTLSMDCVACILSLSLEVFNSAAEAFAGYICGKPI